MLGAMELRDAVLIILDDCKKCEINNKKGPLDAVAFISVEEPLVPVRIDQNVSYPSKPTIEPLAQALYKDKKIDVTELKQIQYLGSIRNKCSHPEPVSAKEVQSLIDGVKKLV